MNYTIILQRTAAKDPTKQTQVIDQLRNIPGVLKLDTEMANNGLVLAQFASTIDLEAVRKIQGVDDLEKNGVKHAL